MRSGDHVDGAWTLVPRWLGRLRFNLREGRGRAPSLLSKGQAEELAEQANRHDEREDRQQRRDDRRRVVVDDEEVPIHLERKHVRRPADATLRIRGPDDDVEQLEFPKKGHRDDDERDRTEQRPRDFSEDLPLRSPVDAGRLEVVFRDRREPRRVHDHTEAGPRPHRPEDQPEEEGVGRDEPVDVERLDPEPPEERRDESDRVLEDESKDDSDDNERRDHPEEDERLDERGPADVLEKNGEEQAHEDRQREVDTNPNQVVQEGPAGGTALEAGGIERVRRAQDGTVVLEARVTTVG